MSAYVVRAPGVVDHYDDVLDAMPAARALAASGVRNVRVFRCDPGGEVLLAFVENHKRELKWARGDSRRGEPVDQHSFQDRAQRGLL